MGRGEPAELGLLGLEQGTPLGEGSRQQYGSMLRSWSKVTWTPIFSRWFRPDHLRTNHDTERQSANELLLRFWIDL